MHILYNERYRAWIIQGLTVFIVLLFIGMVANNVSNNLDKNGIATGFGFLSQTAGYEISMSLIEYSAADTHWDAYVVGLLNTLLVAILGIITATLLGFFVALGRLSSNWLLSRLCYAYLEYFRNVPIIIHLIITYGVVLSLPPIKQAWHFFDAIVLSNRGLTVPSPQFGPGFTYVAITLLLGAASAWFLGRYSRRVFDETEKLPCYMLLKHISLLFIPAMIVYWIADTPITWSIPVLKGFNLQGGINFSPEFGALWLATTIYFGAHISEVIRSGILAVPKGQLEASLALGVRPMRTMFLVIMPQAMRIIVPPMANYYINIIKTSTLGVAIGYPDLMSTTGGTSLNITGQAVECLIMVMATFSLFNLITGLFMNWYNAKVTLVER
jgi:general L-amino acid transport system permease protein